MNKSLIPWKTVAQSGAGAGGVPTAVPILKPDTITKHYDGRDPCYWQWPIFARPGSVWMLVYMVDVILVNRYFATHRSTGGRSEPVYTTKGLVDNGDFYILIRKQKAEKDSVHSFKWPRMKVYAIQ
eukprot:15343440-Ditylum_brightwellii.AAC.1